MSTFPLAAGSTAFSVEFILHTSSESQLIDKSNPDTLTSSNFNESYLSKFIIHGWMESYNTTWVQDMKNELLHHGNYNIVLVDWEEGANNPRYKLSADNTDRTGAEIYHFIKFIQNVYVGYSESRVHLIGFSLGAQVSGATGMRMPTIARITGLDPAGPGFDNHGDSRKLDSSDAQFVDIIHVDGDVTGGVGCWYPSGHVDFYPNGGQSQPACRLLADDGDVSLIDRTSCDHGMAPQYFIESINTDCEFEAYPCTHGKKCYSCASGCNRMGFHAFPHTTGIFYLETNSEKPYCNKPVV
ncbi:inactive pancreatic lipase-related protein 1-like [Saccoglossus kowalevskii]